MHDERARAALVPARDEKLIEIDDVVGMVMRDDERIDVGAASFRFIERTIVLDSQKIDTLLVIPL